MPPSACSKKPRCCALGAGEAALLVAEQLALDQVRRDRAAVDRHERALAGARLSSCSACATTSLPVPLSPMMQHRGVGRRDLRQTGRRRRRIGGEAPDQRPEAAQLAQLVAQRRRSPRCSSRVRATLPRIALQAGDVERLGQIVGDAAPQRLDGGVDTGVPGDQNHGRAARRDVVEQVHAAAIRQHQVAEHELARMVAKTLARLRDAAGTDGSEALALD